MKTIYIESDIYTQCLHTIFYTTENRDCRFEEYIKNNSRNFTDYLNRSGAIGYTLRTLPCTNMSCDEIMLRSTPYTDYSDEKAPITLHKNFIAAIVDIDFSDDCIPIAEILIEEFPDDESDDKQHARLNGVLNTIISIEKEYNRHNAPTGSLSQIRYRTPEVPSFLTKEDEVYIAADIIANDLYNSEKIILSDIYIDEEFNITLPLYPQIRIELAPLPKALYILLLRHPNGFILKEIIEYSNELQEIYCRISGRQNPSVIKKIFNSITDPTMNTLHKNLSIIRHEFMHKLRSDIAQRYIPTFGRYQKHRIPLENSKIFLPEI